MQREPNPYFYCYRPFLEKFGCIDGIVLSYLQEKANEYWEKRKSQNKREWEWAPLPNSISQDLGFIERRTIMDSIDYFVNRKILRVWEGTRGPYLFYFKIDYQRVWSYRQRSSFNEED